MPYGTITNAVDYYQVRFAVAGGLTLQLEIKADTADGSEEQNDAAVQSIVDAVSAAEGFTLGFSTKFSTGTQEITAD